jgi:hypothetical protein
MAHTTYLFFLIRSGTFNYDDKYRGATAKSLSSLKEDKGFSKDGFLLNNARVLMGTGVDTFEKGKSALRSWRYVYASLHISN